MIAIRVERRVVIRANGDVDDFVTFVLGNRGDIAEDLDGSWFTFPFSGAVAELISACDGVDGPCAWNTGTLYGQFLVEVQARGSIPPGSTRVIGVHVLRRERAGVSADEFTFDDPFTLEPLDGLGPGQVEVEATVIFPPHHLLREVVADASAERTSRSVTSRYTPIREVGQYLQQAAAYAADRGFGVGVLLVLDRADHSRERRHQPHLQEELAVELVPSRPSIAGTAGTVVVTVVITAHPPRPSDLRGRRARRARAERGQASQ